MLPDFVILEVIFRVHVDQEKNFGIVMENRFLKIFSQIGIRFSYQMHYVY